MPSFALTLPFLLTLLLPSSFATAQTPSTPFSNYFSTFLPSSSRSFIREAETTLILPALNAPQTGFLKIYPELYTNASASLSATAISLADDRSPCPEDLEGWCVGARMVLGNAQNSGDYVPAPPGARLTLIATYDPPTQKYSQSVSLNGKIVSTLLPSNPANLGIVPPLQLVSDILPLIFRQVAGHGTGFRTQIECQLDICGTVPSHRYVDTKVVLGTADPGFGAERDVKGAKGEWVTNDGGVTWSVEEIVVDEYTYV